MTAAASRVTIADPGPARLGEGPVWDAREQLLHWVDVEAGAWHRFDPADGPRAPRTLGARLSLVVPRRRGGHVAAVDGALLLLDPAGRTEETIELLPPDGDLVLNDGACDARGRLWIGSASRAGRPDGALFRVDPDGTVTTAREGLAMANGIGWSPRHDTLYLVDSGTRELTAAPSDARAGTLGPPRTLATFADAIPDGLAVDADGVIWLALWGAGALTRLAPDGRELSRLPVPGAGQVTSCAFGAGRLWITTAADGAPSGEPHAGALLAHDAPGASGVPSHPFGG
ncbi:SMP-30/gluconolactonase/LRE family protein [Conexibacter sp. JD483]|uniref:SMP-30/gluconolactonase/LRE family protein n=1 Tax=unclassified Conexibacter TaxID=2627773 RepID=UPI0027217D1F|nr:MULTISPECIES: SMP-30/gluconolactonase/LRE family protein [unclassified Conexibacter]MDO8187084.1 SMP-30/gluconolactonase/LRE family protein [Conexibacter sp. CPCC 205706]MDO8200942.1 SMP-30/gluconolactonase/LRE family protein [Conexibacter sp. CPCC 205762]MDR9372222.1 SMP-30/gluconolactonase/LRE family protein [Conexibacter sp. JD483]